MIGDRNSTELKKRMKENVYIKCNTLITSV